MKAKFLFLFLLLLVPLVSSEVIIDVDESNIQGVQIFKPTPAIFNNQTASVNASEFWCTTNQGCLSSTAQIDHRLLTNLLPFGDSGHASGGLVDFSSNAIFNLPSINLSDTAPHIKFEDTNNETWNLSVDLGSLTIKPTTPSSLTTLILDAPIILTPNWNFSYGTMALEWTPTYSPNVAALVETIIKLDPTRSMDTASVDLFFGYDFEGDYNSTVANPGGFVRITGFNSQPNSFTVEGSNDPVSTMGFNSVPTVQITGVGGNAKTTFTKGFIDIPSIKSSENGVMEVEDVIGVDLGLTFVPGADLGNATVHRKTGVKIRNPTETGAGALIGFGDNIGIVFDDQTRGDFIAAFDCRQGSGTDEWCLYLSGGADNYIEGDTILSGGGEAPASLLHLIEAAGTLTLEGANPGSASPIFVIDWVNTDGATIDYVSARMQSFNEGSVADGDLRFSTANNGALIEAMHIHDMGNVEVNFGLDVGSYLNISNEAVFTDNSLLFDTGGTSVGLGWGTSAFLEFDVGGGLQMSLTTDELRFNNPTTLTSIGFVDEGKLDWRIGGIDEVALEDNLFRPERDDEVDLGNETFRFRDAHLSGILNATTYHFTAGGNMTSNGTCVITTSPDGSTIFNICDV